MKLKNDLLLVCLGLNVACSWLDFGKEALFVSALRPRHSKTRMLLWEKAKKKKLDNAIVFLPNNLEYQVVGMEMF